MAGLFDGLRVTSFESRRAKEMAGLIERHGGAARSAPSMRELPEAESPDAPAFAEALLAGRLDMVIFQTGVGARTLMSILEPAFPRERIVAALREVTTVARGPKPVAAMREWGLRPTLLAPEPNTWREVLATVDEAGAVNGMRIAVQEYGEPNVALVAALRERGAQVTPVEVYAWGLPEDLGPMREAIAAIAAGETDVVTFMSAQQVRNVVAVAREMGVEDAFREGLKRTVIASIGPTTSETLDAEGLGHDFEPDRVKMGDFVRGLARSAGMLLERKRASHAAGVDTSRMRRVDAVWGMQESSEQKDAVQDSAFMKACRRERAAYTPVWLMRQAGRYQREYRDLRAKVSFLELCRTPELAAEVTLMAVDQLGVDAAIIFADILLIAEPLGVGVSFNKGDGPRIGRPVRSREDVDRLREMDADALGYVYDAVRLTRRALKPSVPLIGFCGAPFTLASYLIEGGHSQHFVETKSLMYRDTGAWRALMERLVRASAGYLNGQIAAGAQAVQLFDTWAGVLNERDYREYVLPHVTALIEAVRPRVPVIYFGVNTATLLSAMKESGCDVLGMDWRVDLAATWAAVGHDVAVQGNLDPAVLLTTPSQIQQRAHAILDSVAGRPGHIFNLGHGILPETPVDHVMALVDAVHEYEPSEK